MSDQPIDKLRNSGGKIALPDDAGRITDMCEINGVLHMIGGKAIYRVQLADQIDPQRTNIEIPNAHQKVLSFGTEFLIVRQVLMTAKRLFGNNLLGEHFDYNGAINLSFDALLDLAAMHSMRAELRAKLSAISEDMKEATAHHRYFTVPTAGDVRGVAESFLQKADHAAIDLFKIAKLFYGDAIGPRWFQSLHKLIVEKFGEEDPFTKFLGQVLPFLQFVRNARNAMEHPDAGKSVAVTDILLLPSGELQPPCIEVIHSETPQPSVHFLDLMGHVIDHLAVIFEVILAYLCGRNVQPFAGLPLGVIEYTEDQQKAYKCRYGYGTRMGDQIVPFG